MYSTAFSTIRGIRVSFVGQLGVARYQAELTAVDLVGFLVGDLNAELLL